MKTLIYAFQLIFDFIKYTNVDEHRALYDDLLNKCVNVELMNSYSLRAFSSIEYCVKSGNNERELGKGFV